MRLGAPRSEVEDLVQEVFLVAHRRGGFTAGGAKPTTWLAEIGVRVWANRRRTSRRRPEEATADPSAHESASHDPERTLEAARALSRVSRGLEGLDLDHRAVFVLFELEGESCGDIASALGVPVGTVYRRLHTARARFRETYARLTRGGSDAG